MGPDALLHLLEGVLNFGIVVGLLLLVVDDVKLGASLLLLEIFCRLLGLPFGLELRLGYSRFGLGVS